jgi:hypothetical protein
MARQYDKLTVEERYRLMMAAVARGDEIEEQRFVPQRAR